MKYENINEIAIAIINSNEKQIIIYLVALFIAMISTYIISRLKKKGELDEIKNNFNTIINQQTKLAAATESIKSELNKKSIEYQIKLKAINERKIEAINKVYINLIELKEAANTVGINHEKSNREEYLRSIQKFKFEHEINKLWIPEKISDVFEKVAIEIDSNSNPFIIIRGAEDIAKGNEMNYYLSMPDEKFEKQVAIIQRFHDFLSKEIVDELKKVVQEVSESLNV